ncbi:T9SS type A sorting domain-containing protein [Anditalea andensis]|nr:T9SS type A sorting domain-containing protein [Anditalea andensis]
MSSGSPLFDNQLRVIGSNIGGYGSTDDTCEGPNEDARYGRLSMAWHEFKQYLDPNNEGIVALNTITNQPGPKIFSEIQGPENLCSTATYTLENPPLESTITWSASPSYLFTNTTSMGESFTTAPSSINGKGTITATIDSPWGTVLISREIQVGPPTSINGLSHGQILCGNQYLNLWSENGYLSYNWVVLGGTVISGQGSSQVTVLTDNNPFQGQNLLSVRLNVTSTCMDGTSEVIAYVNNCGGNPIDPLIYPNPASDELTIEMSELEKHARNEEEDFSVEIKISNFWGQVMHSQTTFQSKLKLNVQQLKSGLYYIHIRYKDAVIRKQVRVER